MLLFCNTSSAFSARSARTLQTQNLIISLSKVSLLLFGKPQNYVLDATCADNLYCIASLLLVTPRLCRLSKTLSSLLSISSSNKTSPNSLPSYSKSFPNFSNFTLHQTCPTPTKFSFHLSSLRLYGKVEETFLRSFDSLELSSREVRIRSSRQVRLLRCWESSNISFRARRTINTVSNYSKLYSNVFLCMSLTLISRTLRSSADGPVPLFLAQRQPFSIPLNSHLRPPPHPTSSVKNRQVLSRPTEVHLLLGSGPEGRSRCGWCDRNARWGSTSTWVSFLVRQYLLFRIS